MTEPGPTGRLIDHVLSLDGTSLPAEVLQQAKVVLADEIGILLAASRERTVTTALRAVARGAGTCTVVGHGGGATPDQAAFLNGCGGHDIELDDSHSPSRTHSAAVLVPAVLAAAEHAGGSTGADILAGLVGGYDVSVRVSKAMGPQAQYDKGFHPTSVCGAIGATAAAGRVVGLSEDQMHHALTLATSQASGLLTWQDDSTHMIKSFQPGTAARNAVTAVLFAEQGFQGIREVFTGRHTPLRTFGGPEPEPGLLVDALGERYDIRETSIKRHACGGHTHAALDALLTIMAEHGLVAADIDHIDVQMPRGGILIVDDNPLLIANVQYVLAVAAHVGLVKREHFRTAWTDNPDVLALKQKVTLRGSDELDTRFPAMKGAIVTVQSRGRSFTQQYDSPPGSPMRPLSVDEIKGKFLDLALTVVEQAGAEELWSVLESFEKVANTSRFFELLAGEATS
jgi:2-methylcitrate dehydratase PrpD